MDITSAFKSEVFRPLVTLIIPGSTALGPWIIVAGHHIPRIASFRDDHSSAFTAIMVIAVLTAGLILEELGAFIEGIWDKILRNGDEWNEYLMLQVDDKYVGQRYLRQWVIRLKFELSMGPALFFFWMGLGFINREFSIWTWGKFQFLSWSLIALASYMVLESFRSSKGLTNTRTRIIAGCKAAKMGVSENNSRLVARHPAGRFGR